ncbi:type I inositol-1,4,5-trisphosphate 5-phosphatase [Musa troglodytarum]|uniref:Type I inositol-1,4,5-trisphosphate 5-phosphatase n=1 Tax=Musa troglodytarum TaxID=320322 RepID=A0A9E7FZ48_9LILI|nr:type I inositol-1,4,5-trisphosphate 5-phosphatase [Musa troglodytarum]
MRDENSKKSKLSWSKTLVRKWFNIKSKPQDFHADDDLAGEGGDGEWRTSFTERETCTVKKSRTERLYKKNYDRVWRGKSDVDAAQSTDVQDYKFQEIVPLNAGNVLGAEDNVPAKKWLALIRKTLNTLPGTYSCGSYSVSSPVPDPLVELDADFEGSSTRMKNSSFFHRRSFHSMSRSMSTDDDLMAMQPTLERRFSVCDPVSRPSNFDHGFRCGGLFDDKKFGGESPSTGFFSPLSCAYGDPAYVEERDIPSYHSRYCLVASKQMVGIFLTVWVRSEIRGDVKNLKVSCVGRGLMGYLGNKGSISISMSLHQTSFCFICSHLTSGQKEGDELRRNSDVMEILRKTRFPPVQRICDEKSPETILDHDRIIWLGDLNYRIALSYQSTKALVEMHNWRALLEKDQQPPGNRHFEINPKLASPACLTARRNYLVAEQPVKSLVQGHHSKIIWLLLTTQINQLILFFHSNKQLDSSSG